MQTTVETSAVLSKLILETLDWRPSKAKMVTCALQRQYQVARDACKNVKEKEKSKRQELFSCDQSPSCVVLKCYVYKLSVTTGTFLSNMMYFTCLMSMIKVRLTWIVPIISGHPILVTFKLFFDETKAAFLPIRTQW